MLLMILYTVIIQIGIINSKNTLHIQNKIQIFTVTVENTELQKEAF